MRLIYLKSELKCDSFDVTLSIKILFFRVSVTIEPGRSLLQFGYHELFDKKLNSLARSAKAKTYSENIKYYIFIDGEQPFIFFFMVGQFL